MEENCFINQFGVDANDYALEQALAKMDKEDAEEKECISKLGYAYYL